MAKKSYMDKVFQFCEKCEGVWIDKDVLKDLAKVDPAASRELKCVECGTSMMMKAINDVEIDICPLCHTIWLDRGEMEKLTLIDPASGLTKKMSELITKEMLEGLDL